MRALFVTGLLAFSMFGAISEARTPISRYAYLAPGSSLAQRHPLQVTLTQINFPQEIATVGEALQYLLARSGYRLDAGRSPWAQAILMPHPLPEVHRDLGPIHLADALAILVGDAWRLKVNPLYRTLIIKPTQEWQAQLERSPSNIEIEEAQPWPSAPVEDELASFSPSPDTTPALTDVDSPADDRMAVDLTFAASLNDPAEIFVDDMTLQQALELLVPIGWTLHPEVPATLLNTHISLISSTTWWDALTELTRKLGTQTQSELLLHVFEDQKLVVLEQT